MAYAVQRKIKSGNSIIKVWYVRYKDEQNIWQYKSCGKDATRADADFLANKHSSLELNRHHKAPVRVIKTDLDAAIIQFRDDVIPRSTKGIDKQASSIQKEQSSVNNVLRYVQEQEISHFKEFDKEFIQKYLDFRQTIGLSASTRKEELRLIKKFSKWGMKQNFLTENPSEDFISPKLPKKRHRFFSEAELKKIFSLAKEPYLTIFKFLYLTGLRSGELSNLEWRDYDEKNRTLTIRIVAQDKKKRTPGNKTKRVETIPINDAAHQILMARKASDESDTFIFLNRSGNRLDDENIYRNLLPILKKLGIRGACVHTFRHTFASHLVIANVSIYKVRDLLRHASVRETEVYSHLSKESTRTAVDLIDQKMKTEIEINDQHTIKEVA